MRKKKDDDSDGSGLATAILGKAVTGASLLASVQLLSRGFTFFLNVALTRRLGDASLLGIASVQLHLLYTLVLTLAREGVRRTCLRIAAARGVGDRQSERTRRDLVNLTWRAVIAGCAATPCFCAWFIFQADPVALQSVSLYDYAFSIKLMGVAIGLELLSEPFFVAAQGQLLYGLRSKIEALGVTTRCVLTFYLVVYADARLSGFAYGYVGYGATLLLSYVAFFSRQTQKPSMEDNLWTLDSFSDLLPADFLLLHDEKLEKLALDMTAQQLWKVLLAEGEKVIMMMFSMEASDQAVYALVFNLGSLVARFVFQPIEETAFAVFGKLNDLSTQGRVSDNESSPSHLLEMLSRTMSLIGLVFVAFGPSFSHFLVHFLYGERWSNETDAPLVLGYYCFYVLLLAVNGVTEAFAHAVGDQNDVKSFNHWLLIFSAVYLVSAAFLIRFHAVGLIFANCVNMLMRIGFSLNFIAEFENEAIVIVFPRLFPSLLSLVAFVIAAALARISEALLYSKQVSFLNSAFHISFGGFILVLLAIFLYLSSEKHFVAEMRRLRSVLRKGSTAQTTTSTAQPPPSKSKMH